MAITKLRPTFTFDQERLDALKAIAPEAFADGKINWETLKEALGEHLEDEEQETEHFGLTWPGKRAARRLASQPSAGTLRSAPGEGLDEETTHHVFIEGDNLEVLKLLQKSYAGRVKMIYIDPPYNTGNDFVYKDDYRQPLEEYLRATGQADEAGRVLTTNTKSGGRFHSNWLNVMYPRLRLARNLLSSDGIIFVSIDDTEVHNLRMLMNEMFGEENFISEIVWKNKYGPGAQTKGVASLHEYILCYSKGTIESIESMLSEEETKQYKLRDEKFAVRGGYTTQPLATRSKDDRPNLVYPIEYKGKTIWPNKQWIWARERMEQALKNNEVVISEKSGEFSVRFKQYLRD
jgi:adenine-specific DNA-methyltransferase